MADEEASYHPGLEPVESLAEARIRQQGCRRLGQLLNGLGRRERIDRRQKLIKPDHIGQGFTGPLQFHQRGAGRGESVLKLSAHSRTA